MQKKFLTPMKITENFVETGRKKARLTAAKQVVLGIGPGASIAFSFRNGGEFDSRFSLK